MLILCLSIKYRMKKQKKLWEKTVLVKIIKNSEIVLLKRVVLVYNDVNDKF